MCVCVRVGGCLKNGLQTLIKKKSAYRFHLCPHTFSRHIRIITLAEGKSRRINTICSSLRGTCWESQVTIALFVLSRLQALAPFSLVPLQTAGENYDLVLTELSPPIRTTKYPSFSLSLSPFLSIELPLVVPFSPTRVSRPPSLAQLHPFSSRGKRA